MTMTLDREAMLATSPDRRAFPHLDEKEMESLARLAVCEEFADGAEILKAGQADIDFFVVESGLVDILNPAAGHELIVTHAPGQFIGDIDLLTRRPIIVSARARGKTRVLRVPGAKLRQLLNTIPSLSEKLLVAFQARREMLQASGVLGIKVIGHGHCRDTTMVREFLYKNFVPYMWYDLAEERGQIALREADSSKRSPVVVCGNGQVLVKPSLPEISHAVGIWRECPSEEYDLVIVGAGPAGISAAVYAASEGLSTIVVDRLGPGGQAGGSSRIENFIGFPEGLSGADLATRGVLQMLKFGASVCAPVTVEKLVPAKTPGDLHLLHLDCGGVLRAKVVLLATGVTWRRLEVPGAQRYDRAGIYYACTVVESSQHEGSDVAVVGAGNSAGQAAMFLAERCAAKVHLLVRRSEMSASMSKYLEERIKATPNIEVHYQTEIAEVLGNRHLEGVILSSRRDGSRSELKCGAVFVFIGAEPHSNWLPKEVARDEFGYLLAGADVTRAKLWSVTDRDPCPLETSIPGILAAGDVRSGATKRVGFAVGEGSLACSCVHKLTGIATAAMAAR